MRAKLYSIQRDLFLCDGFGKCRTCLEHLPGLESGDIRLAGWALLHNEKLINQAIMSCNCGAIEVINL